MKHLIKKLTVLSFAILSILQSNATTYTNTGNSTGYNLSSGDILNVTSGTYTGSINSFHENARINISSGATFNPSGMNNPAGTINNYGTINFASLSTKEHFTINNYSVVNFNQSVGTNEQTTFNNMTDGFMKFNSSFSLSNNSVINNRGTLVATKELSTNNGTAIYNKPNALIRLLGNFNPNGTIVNDAKMRVLGNMTINSNASITNNNILIVDNNFTNNSSSTSNTGLLMLTGASSSNGVMTNNANFYNSASGYVVGVKFVNNSPIKGSGNYYFSGQTTNQASFGSDGNGINFFDTGLPTNIFDVQNTTPHSTVTKRSFTSPDTNFTFPAPLPISMLSFVMTYTQGAAHTNWTTASENNTDHFELERSIDNQTFELVTMINAAGHSNNLVSYEYTDVVLNAKQSIAYRIKEVDLDGTFNYSETIKTNIKTKLSQEFAIYPNPFKDAPTLRLETTKTETAKLVITDMSGKYIYNGSIDLNAGTTNYLVKETEQLPEGTYIIRIQGADFTEALKVIKL